jgi:hypothetical protein
MTLHKSDTSSAWSTNNAATTATPSSNTAAKTSAATETDLDTKLCVDKTFAKKYNFDGSQFTKNAQYADLPGILDEAEFDMGSIMMYPSNAFSNPECWPKSMDKVDGKVTGMSWIHGSLAPSAGEEVVSLGWYWW